MGFNVKMLAEKQAAPGLHHGHALNIEIEECIHFHLEDFRFVWTTQELLKIADAFADAKKFVIDLGTPEYTDRHYTTGSVTFDGPRMHNDRWAVEMTRDGTIHIHNKSLRTHMTQADFYEYATMMGRALLSLNTALKTTINITDTNIRFPSPVSNYIPMLERYDQGLEEKQKAEDVSRLRDEVKWYITHPKGKETTDADLQRPSGMLPSKFPGIVPEELNTRYLFSLYESIKKWGYATGPFYNDLMPAYKYKDGSIYLKGAHRSAVLKHLGYTSVDVILTAPPTT